MLEQKVGIRRLNQIAPESLTAPVFAEFFVRVAVAREAVDGIGCVREQRIDIRIVRLVRVKTVGQKEVDGPRPVVREYPGRQGQEKPPTISIRGLQACLARSHLKEEVDRVAILYLSSRSSRKYSQRGAIHGIGAFYVLLT